MGPCRSSAPSHECPCRRVTRVRHSVQPGSGRELRSNVDSLSLDYRRKASGKRQPANRVLRCAMHSPMTVNAITSKAGAARWSTSLISRLLSVTPVWRSPDAKIRSTRSVRSSGPRASSCVTSGTAFRSASHCRLRARRMRSAWRTSAASHWSSAKHCRRAARAYRASTRRGNRETSAASAITRSCRSE
jgi:hypothetical protein